MSGYRFAEKKGAPGVVHLLPQDSQKALCGAKPRRSSRMTQKNRAVWNIIAAIPARSQKCEQCFVAAGAEIKTEATAMTEPKVAIAMTTTAANAEVIAKFKQVFGDLHLLVSEDKIIEFAALVGHAAPSLPANDVRLLDIETTTDWEEILLAVQKLTDEYEESNLVTREVLFGDRIKDAIQSLRDHSLKRRTSEHYAAGHALQAGAAVPIAYAELFNNGKFRIQWEQHAAPGKYALHTGPRSDASTLVQEAEFEIHESEMQVASASGPRNQALIEAARYANQYGADGSDIAVYEVCRTEIHVEALNIAAELAAVSLSKGQHQ